MSFRTRLVIFLLVALLAAALDALFSPFFVAYGVRLWLEWAARQEGLRAQVKNVDAPFLHPVTIRNLRLTSDRVSAREVSLQAGIVIADLNFRGKLFSRNASFLRSVNIDRLTGSIHGAPRLAAAKKLDWRQMARLLPVDFRIEHGDLDVTTATTSVSFRDVFLTASAIESGKFLARRLSIASPLLRQSFRDLRGATSWESDRLTIAGIPLVHGLDLEALTFDLSHLERRRLGVDLHLDAYGGTLRASFQGRAGGKFAIDVAGSASNISLAQISRAMGFLEPISGAVRASKFTFRGNPGEFLDATASIWMELTDFAWRAHRADNIMLGATYYDRRLEVDQLYVRQGQNQLTINGELLWPKERGSWTHLPFRGQLNATIPDLNGFAELFGARTGDFTGALLADGEIDSLPPQAHGRLALHGKGVTFRGVTVDTLGASLQLKGSELTLENLEARHAEDFLRAHGSIELTSAHLFDARLTGAINDLQAYAPLLPVAWRASKIGGGATFDWRGDGTLAASSGTMQFVAHGLQLPIAPLRMPLDVTLEGSYSPRDIFFRTLQIGNDRIWLGGFLMLGGNFIELQAMQFAIDSVPRINGTLFLPFSANRWRTSHSLIEAFDEAQKFDVDLTVDHLDLAGLAHALGEKSSASGVLDGKLAAFGPLRALQLTTNWRLENVGAGSPHNLIDFYGYYSDGWAEANATATFGVSDPLNVRVTLPLHLEKDRFVDGRVLDRAAPFSVTVDCPALFFDTLPYDRRFGATGGLLSGEIAFSNTLQAPNATGEAEILDGRLKPPSPWPEVSALAAQIHFGNGAALMDPLRCKIEGTPVTLRARLTTSGNAFRFALTPLAGGLDLLQVPASGSDISSIRLIGQGTAGTKPRLRDAVVRGTIGSPGLSLTLYSEASDSGRSFPSQTTFFLGSSSRNSRPLLLQALPPETGATIQLAQPSR
ncbi:MAG: hypothetical protein ACREIF_10220 [Chthoniobacterales bacterium]